MTRWDHIHLPDLVEGTGISLESKGEDKWIGPHPHRHDSKSGSCLVVWGSRWWCSSCRAKGDHVDWLLDIGKVGDRLITDPEDAIGYLLGTYGPPPTEWQEPVPFPVFSGPLFPFEVLPKELSQFVRELSTALQVPADLVGGLVLGVVSAAATGKARIRVKPEWEEHLNIWTVLGLDSGERKTPALQAAIQPLEEIQRGLAEEAAPLIVEAEARREMLEGQLTNTKREAAKLTTTGEKRNALAIDAVELAKQVLEADIPTTPRLICDDVTSEALASLLAENRGVMALISDEGGFFETMAGRYSDGQVAIDVYLKSYSGKTPLRVDRKGRAPEFVDEPRLTIVLCVQPEIIQKLALKSGFRGRGLLARPLYMLPESHVGYRDIDPPSVSEDTRTAYETTIHALASLTPESEQERHILMLTPKAKFLSGQFRLELEPQLRPGGVLRDIRDWVHKLDGVVVKLAGLLHLVVNVHLTEPWQEPVQANEMESALSLGRYFTEHALAAFGLMGVGGGLITAKDLWGVVQRLGVSQFTKRDVHQAVRHKFSSEDVEEGLRVLQEYGYIEPLVNPSSTSLGGRPSRVYEANPLVRSPFSSNERGFEGFELKEINLTSDFTSPSDREEEEISPVLDSTHVPTLPIEKSPSNIPAALGRKIVGKDHIYGKSSESTDTENPVGPLSNELVNTKGSQENKNISIAQNAQNTQTLLGLDGYRLITSSEETREIAAGLKSKLVIGLDIETTGLDPILDKIRTVQLATGEQTYVFDCDQVPVQELIPVLSGGPVKVVHNAKFDAGFLWDSQAAVMPGPLFDTMLADQVIHNRSYGRSLKDLAKEYLDIELDKDLQQSNWSGDLSSEQLVYVARDSAILLPLFERLTKEAAGLGMKKVVELENRAIPPMVWMERGGVCFDQEKWNRLGDIAREKADEARTQLDAISVESLSVDSLFGKQAPYINWNSTAQVLITLKELGLSIEDTKQETLEKVKERHPIVPALLAYREATKHCGTYGTNWVKHVHRATGRIHPDWRQLGAETGRMACKKPNLQNLPRDRAYRECFRAAPGHVLVKADYSQIELRLVAEIANDARMVQAFKEGQDLHVLAAMSINGKKDPAEITPEERQLAKAVNFGLIYGLGAKRLAAQARSDYHMELSEEHARDMRDRYFREFSGLRRWHQKQGRQSSTRTPVGSRRVWKGGSHLLPN